MADHPNVGTFRSIYPAFTAGVIVFEVRDGVVRAAWEVWKDQPSVDELWSA